MTLAAAPWRAVAFEHEALFYAGTDDFVAQTVPFVREGLAGGEAVLAASLSLGCAPSRRLWAPTPDG
jgi:hypothetical protein